MAIPVYSEVLIREHSFTGTATVDTPGGSLIIVRDIDVEVGISDGGTVTAQDQDGVQFWAFTETSVEVGKVWFGWRGRQVIVSGGSFSLVTDFECDIRASGYVLSLP